MMIKSFEGFGGDQNVTITHKSEHGPEILLVVAKDDRIKRVSNPDGIDFPFLPGDRVKWSRLSEWACENDYLIDGKDVCPEDDGFLRSSMGRMFGM
jgi:hypothetical protein